MLWCWKCWWICFGGWVWFLVICTVWMQNNGDGLGFWELQLVGLWVVGGGRGWKWEEKGFNVSGFVKEEREKKNMKEMEERDMLPFWFAQYMGFTTLSKFWVKLTRIWVKILRRDMSYENWGWVLKNKMRIEFWVKSKPNMPLILFLLTYLDKNIAHNREKEYTKNITHNMHIYIYIYT